MAPHRSSLESEESQARERLLAVHRLVDQAIAHTMQCLRSGDLVQAAEVVEGDGTINAECRRIEEECLLTIARQQPVARDLRVLMADVQIAMELERIGDHAVNVAKIIQRGELTEPLPGFDGIEEMAAMAREMVAEAMEAYASGDVELARALAAQDNRLDRLEEELVGGWLESLCEVPEQRFAKVHMLWIEHHLERIGDRATNIAERAIFLHSGETVKLND